MIYLFSRKQRRKRRTHWPLLAQPVFGLGTAKSGTHSLAHILSRYCPRHEYGSGTTRRLLVEQAKGQDVAQELLEAVAQPEGAAIRSVHISHLFSLAAPQIVQAHPTAKAILLMRDPYTWLDSMVNHLAANAAQGTGTDFGTFWETQLGTPAPNEADKALHVEGSSFSLEAYLNYWTRVNQTVLSAFAESQLLVIRTPDLRESLPRIAEFLDLPPKRLSAKNTHSFTARTQEHRLRRLDPDYLDERVQAICGPLLERFHPELHSVRDTKLLG